MRTLSPRFPLSLIHIWDLLLEEGQAPSTNELAKAFSINPATAAKGLNLLVDEGILYKNCLLYTSCR